jgi:hypothetical protein
MIKYRKIMQQEKCDKVNLSGVHQEADGLPGDMKD